MLKGIDPLLSPDLLSHLRAMVHGDTIGVVDANFPAAATARRLVRLDGHDAVRVLDAVLSVLPLDDFGDACATRMEVVGDPHAHLAVFDDFLAVLDRHVDGHVTSLGALERHAFYEAARAAYVIVATGETRLYGNILLRKGVIRA